MTRVRHTLSKAKKKGAKIGIPEITAETGATGVGAAVGVLIGGPAGAAVGAMIGQVALEVLQKSSERRQQYRIDRALHYARDRFYRNIGEGCTVREDGFFATPPEGRSKGAEVVEGVLLKARDAYEEKKLPYIGNILANAAVSHYDVGLIHNALKLADDVTYRGLLCMALVERLQEFSSSLPAPETEGTGDDTNSVLIEFESILQRNLISRFEPRRPFTISAAQSGPAKPFIIPVSTLVLTSLGSAVYSLMSLETIPHGDIQDLIVRPLKG